MRRSEQGFSLIEALFALAILAMALTIALAMVWTIPRQVRRLDAQVEAMRAMELAMETVRAGGWPVRQQRDGEFDWPYDETGWRAVESMSLWIDVEAAAVPDLYRVTVIARYRVLDEARERRLTTQQWLP